MTGRMGMRSVLAALGLVLVTGAPAAAAPAGPPHGSGAVAYTREDTNTVEYTEPFAAPGTTALIGDFAGAPGATGDLDDVFWYTPGAGGDALWQANGDRTWTTRARSVDGTYTPLVGAFTDDGKDDIFWYAPGPAPDSLWDFNPDGSVTVTRRNVSGVYTPVVGHFTDDAGDDIVWYAPGRTRDPWWDFDGAGGLTDRQLNIAGTFTPIVGQFGGEDGHGDGVDDILWYRPGPGYDRLYGFAGQGESHGEITVTVDGDYVPVVGDFTGDGSDDIIWYGPGKANDSLWTFPGGYLQPTATKLRIDGFYEPVAANLFDQAAHQTDVLWWGKGSRPDAIWDFTDGPVPTDRPVTVPGDLPPAVGTFEARTVAGTPVHGADILNRTS